MLQFGGHRTALNMTVAGECGVLTPRLEAPLPSVGPWSRRLLAKVSQTY